MAAEPEEPVVLDDYHWHEALDRTNIVMCMFDDFVATGPAVTSDPELIAIANRVEVALHELYRAIGKRHL